MPNYDFECLNEECSTKLFDVFMLIKDYTVRVKCPQCKTRAQRVYNAPESFVKLSDSDCKTLGHIGMRNWERASEDERYYKLNQNKPHKL